MKSQARVVVIGGGIGGCSALCHLALEGRTDVVLVERDELTSGTTWHSAAQSGARRKRVLLEVNCRAAPCQPGESIYHDAAVVGTVTPAAWGFRARKNLAMAYVSPEFATPGSELEVALLGCRYRASVIVIQDPTGIRAEH